MMSEKRCFNIFCDESCHLENDHRKAMVMGCVWCPCEKAGELARRLRELKRRHGLAANFEVKWTKVSPAKADFYLDYLRFFFDDPDLHFRGVVIPDKSVLDHPAHGQTHDEFYYKMYYQLLTVILDPKAKYRIYLDIKDTRSARKVKKLHEVLSWKMCDFSMDIIEWIQNVRSHEIEMMQMTDLLIGALSYVHRDLHSNQAKNLLIEMLRERSGYPLTTNTLYREDKVNLLIWRSGEQCR